MKSLNRILAIALMLQIVFSGCAPSLRAQASKPSATDQKVILQACRDAVLELKFAREKEALLLKQVEELKAVNSAQSEQVAHLNAAIAKYELAVTARTQAEALVSELRANYEKQLSQAEKALAVEKQKGNLWKALAIVGVVIGFALGSKQ